MRSPPFSPAQSLSTPLEPAGLGVARAAAQTTLGVQQAVHATAFRRIEAAVASSCGSQHGRNEDAHSVLDPAGALFVVADGVGGGAMAQLASRLLVDHLHGALADGPLDADHVRHAMLGADRAIAERIARVTSDPGAATVALCAPVNLWASKWLLAWVGDCRVYRLAMAGEREIEPLTRDDTFRHLGELPPAGGSLDDPARMVGNGAIAGANVALFDLACGDLLALCSDGVHKHIDSASWHRVLMRPASLAEHCADLIALARANGSADDATVLLVQRHSFSLPRPRWMARAGALGDTPGDAR